MIYNPTALEKWVSTMYIRKGVLLPGDLRRQNIEKVFRFDYLVLYSPAFFVEEEGVPYVVVDKRGTVQKQREQFFHELCHLLRHDGWQGDLMTEAFRELQEWDAKNFARYAAIPYHMLYLIDFYDRNAAYIMSDIFNVTVDLCMERLEKIKNRMLERERIG
jgi:Zn-dependent peptidase ImmA (M78 family)